MKRGVCLLALLGLSGCGNENDAEPPAPVPVALEVELTIGGEPFVCGASYPGIGSPPADFTITDARFYAHDFALVDRDGKAHAVALAESAYQGRNLALLDFENGCGPDGTPGTNTVVRGTVAPGDYSGVRFTLGVPAEQNFVDLASAKPPLDVSGMFWIWQFGYKYLKIDGSVPAREGGINPFLVHVGSSGCPGENPESPPEQPCAYPNRVTYELTEFSGADGRIVAELAGVLALSDLSSNTEGTAPGCMSEPDDPECRTLLPRLGIDDTAEQLLFHAE
jgi:uncharacterized repeat protein (TIGR04052 family)